MLAAAIMRTRRPNNRKLKRKWAVAECEGEKGRRLTILMIYVKSAAEETLHRTFRP